MQRQRSARVFATRKWPIFGKRPYDDSNPGSSVTSSPYYWWFRFLQLSDSYDAAVTKKGARKLRDVAKDFGRVRGESFKEWWSQHSALFQEPSGSYDMVIVERAEQLVPLDDDSALNLVIPLDWSVMGIRRKFAKIIQGLVSEGRLKSATRGFAGGVSKAQYQIARRWNIPAMAHAYAIYQCKEQARSKGERLAWADAAIRAKIPAAKGLREGDLSAKASERRVVLTILATRHYKRAEKYIDASASRYFP